jgi:hypothetical protein
MEGDDHQGRCRRFHSGKEQVHYRVDEGGFAYLAVEARAGIGRFLAEILENFFFVTDADEKLDRVFDPLSLFQPSPLNSGKTVTYPN